MSYSVNCIEVYTKTKYYIFMPYKKWFQKTVKKNKSARIQPMTLYRNTLIFGLAVFGLAYGYTTFLEIPGVLNKAVANTAIILMGCSMLLSSLCYFWDFVDDKIIYRKHLGLIGYAFGLAHVVLSFPALKRLMTSEAWSQTIPWAPLTGLGALVIFTIMALISNKFAAHKLGGKTWRIILRTGYIAIILTWIHVVALKSKYWIRWAEAGFDSWPSLSFVTSVFMLVVVLMRIALWWSVRNK